MNRSFIKGHAVRASGMLTFALTFLASIPGDAPAQLRAPSQVGGAALLVLDLQVDFIDPAGRLPISHDQIPPVLAAANRAIAAANGHLAVAYIGNEYGFWDIPGNWFRRGAAMKSSFGSALDPLVTRIAGAPYFAKHRGDAFSNDALERFLVSNDIERVVLAGVYADACIYCTARSAINRGYRVTVLTDAVGAASDEDRRAALQSLSGLGVEVDTVAHFESDIAHQR
jgi:nicotinamidase/pyrazinamidase